MGFNFINRLSAEELLLARVFALSSDSEVDHELDRRSHGNKKVRTVKQQPAARRTKPLDAVA